MQEVNYLRLVENVRLDPNDPQQKKVIDAHLAFMDVERPEEAKRLRALYDEKLNPVVEEVPVVEEPVAEEEDYQEEAREKKAKSKKSTPKK